MGTWAAGSFGNDSAGDWIIDLLENPSYAFLEETLRASMEDPHDSMLNENAVAAAEVICIINTGTNPKDYDEVSHNLEPALEKLTQQEMPPRLGSLALQSVEMIEQNSELKELWEEDDEWADEIRALKQRLKRSDNQQAVPL